MAAGGDLAAGDLAAETRGLVEACNFPQDDPRRVMGALAVRLAEAIDRAGPARPPSVLVGEFRGLLRDMGDNPARRADGLDHVRLHRHQRRIAAHLHGVVPDA